MTSSKVGTIANERTARAAWLLAAALFFVGCASHRSQTRVMSVAPMPLEVLGAIPSGTDRESIDTSATLARLRTSLEQASRDYEAGHYRVAAKGFMAAARGARGEPASYTRSVLADSRSVAYRNAARAWFMADALDEGRPELERAAVEDAQCKAEIDRMLEQLPR